MIFDSTKLVADYCPPSKLRNLALVSHVLLHRIDVGDYLDAMAAFFSDKKNGTGGRFPYHFVIFKDGIAHQCVPLNQSAPGAANANPYSVQVALVGDFRKEKPTPEQYKACVAVCAHLVDGLPNLSVKIEGHMDGEGRSADVKKVCPGKFLEPKAVAQEVKSAVEVLRRERLKAGFRG